MNSTTLAMGASALTRLRQDTARAIALQHQTLLELMEENRDTEYGRRHGFAQVETAADYQRLVPLSDYANYDAYIQRAIAGQPGQLTAADPVFYAITSGSTGLPKYVPVTQADMRIHRDDILCGVLGQVAEHYQGLPPEQVFGKIFQVGEFVDTCLPTGQMNGIRTSAVYQWMHHSGTFDASRYCAPREVLFPRGLEDLTYVKVRFALAEPNITAIHGVFLHRIVTILDYICQNWALLLRDMAQGTVDASIPLSDAWREKLAHWLPPNPARAAELARLELPQNTRGLVQKLWPNIKYILGVGGRLFPSYTEAMAQFAPGVPIHHFIYGASEGFQTLSPGLDRPDEYILLPRAGFFEFLPLDAPPGQPPLTISGVVLEEKYELIITNRSGLYRYRMQDVVQVVGFYGQAPIIRLCYRINQVLNVADEKMDTEQLRQAFQLFALRTGISPNHLCAQADFTTRPGRYRIYAQLAPRPDADRLMDECLGKASHGYWGCRVSGDLSAPQVCFLPADAFARYEASLAQDGKLLTQYKPVQILDTPEKQSFFAALAGELDPEKRRPYT